jgi:hypothetical protein
MTACELRHVQQPKLKGKRACLSFNRTVTKLKATWWRIKWLMTLLCKNTCMNLVTWVLTGQCLQQSTHSNLIKSYWCLISQNPNAIAHTASCPDLPCYNAHDINRSLLMLKVYWYISLLINEMVFQWPSISGQDCWIMLFT